MRALSIVACVFLGCLMSGCLVTSREAFYTEKDVVWEPSLVGIWRVEETTNPPDTWTFEKAEDLENTYRLTVVEEGKMGVFTARLFKLDDRTFLDLLPADFPEEGQEGSSLSRLSWRYVLHLQVLRLHSVSRIWLQGDTIRLADLDVEWFTEQTVKDTASLQVSVAGGESEDEVEIYVLSGSTSDIQEFVALHATDSEAFSDPVSLRRTQPPAA